METHRFAFWCVQPNFGASLHILKVEIGGDAQSTGESYGTAPFLYEYLDLSWSKMVENVEYTLQEPVTPSITSVNMSDHEKIFN